MTHSRGRIIAMVESLLLGERLLVLGSALAVAVAGFIVFRESISHGFVMFDDDINIYRNEHLGVFSLDRVTWALTDLSYTRRYMPLGWLMLICVFQWGGLNPAYYHFATVLLHCVNGFILCILLHSVAKRTAARGGAVLLSTSLALWWVLHPLRVETVAWSSGILYQGALLFGLPALLIYCLAEQQPTRRLQRIHYLASGLCYTSSLLVYPCLLGLLGLPIAWEIYKRVGRSATGKESIPAHAPGLWFRLSFWLVAFAFGAAVSLYASATASGIWTDSATATLSSRVLVTPLYFAVLSWRVIMPNGLSPVYDILIDRDFNSEAVWLGFAWVSFVAIALVWCVKKRSWGFVCSVFACFCILFPASPILAQMGYPCDRYTNGFMLALVLCILIGIGHHLTRRAASVVAIGVLLFTVAWLNITIRQQRIWRDTEVLLSYAISGLNRPVYIRNTMIVRLAQYRYHYIGDRDGALRTLGNLPAAQLTQVGQLNAIEANTFVPLPARELFRLATSRDIPAGDFATGARRLQGALYWAPRMWQARLHLAAARYQLGCVSAAKLEYGRAVKDAGSEIDPEIKRQFELMLDR